VSVTPIASRNVGGAWIPGSRSRSAHLPGTRHLAEIGYSVARAHVFKLPRRPRATPPGKVARVNFSFSPRNTLTGSSDIIKSSASPLRENIATALLSKPIALKTGASASAIPNVAVCILDEPSVQHSRTSMAT
jgi:hypothetical protein